MGGVLITCVLSGVNRAYGPFFGIERSDTVVSEGGQAPSPWSFGGIVRNFLDIKDGYHAQTTGGVSLNDVELSGVNTDQPV